MTATDDGTARSPGAAVWIVAALALGAAAVRLLPLQFLHPLNWDEIEFFRATSWIAQGRFPYRDFWEHHTPLAWFLFAPVTALVDSPGVAAVIALRWAQIPVWAATFWLLHAWMRNAGIGAFERWAATALALSSSLFMLPAVEFRVDSVACMLFVAGLVAWQKASGEEEPRPTPDARRPARARWALLSGVLFCLCGFANIRLGPLLAVTVLLLRVVDTRARAWRGERRANLVIGGAAATFVAGLLGFAAAGSLPQFYRQVWFENYLGDKFAGEIIGGFSHRLLVPFGIRVIGSDRLFELAAVDVGGIALLLIGLAGMVAALAAWRAPGDLFVLGFLQMASLLFIASMKLVYNYHLLVVAVVMVPLVASMFSRVRWRPVVIGLLAVAWGVNLFASVFRGKELDRAYQDLVMRESDARTSPGEKVWVGLPWALRREPSYRFWFLPDLARYLVIHGHAEPWRVRDLVAEPPALVVFDHYALVWLVTVQRDIAPYLIRHYLPVWRNLWVPGMNVRLRPDGRAFEWIVPRDGTYRLHVSRDLARHLWFRDPLGYVSYKKDDAARYTVELPAPAPSPDLRWWIDRRPADVGASVSLRKGQRIGVASTAGEPLAVLLLASDDRKIFRQPPEGATLEAETTRVTHVPRIGVELPR